MGDPRRIKKKYAKPKHPWRVDVLESEREILKEYGLKNKKEIWRMEALVRGFRRQARKLLALKTEQAKKEEKLLLDKLERLGVLKQKLTISDVLSLDIKHILERRLQTIIYKKGLAKTVWQARQLIVHGHVGVAGKRVTIPSYLVKSGEEGSINLYQMPVTEKQKTSVET